MDHSTAEKLMSIYGRLGAVLNEAEPLIRALPDEAERKKHLSVVGTVMQDVWTELMAPIAREHRDQDPDRRL